MHSARAVGAALLVPVMALGASCALVTRFDLQVDEATGGASSSTVTGASSGTGMMGSNGSASSSSGSGGPSPWAYTLGPIESNGSGDLIAMARGPQNGVFFVVMIAKDASAPMVLGTAVSPGSIVAGFVDGTGTVIRVNAGVPMQITQADIPRTLRIQAVDGASRVARIGLGATTAAGGSVELGRIDMESGVYSTEVRCTSASGLAYMSALPRPDGGLVAAFQQDFVDGDVDCTYGGVAAGCTACTGAQACVDPIAGSTSVVHLLDVPATGACTRTLIKADGGVTDEFVSAPRLAHTASGDVVLTGYVTHRLFGNTPAEINPTEGSNFAARFAGPNITFPPAEAHLAHRFGADGGPGAATAIDVGGEVVLLGSTGLPSDLLIQTGDVATIAGSSAGDDTIVSAQLEPAGIVIAGRVAGLSSGAPMIGDHACGADCADAYVALLDKGTLGVIASKTFGSTPSDPAGTQIALYGRLTGDGAFVFGGVYDTPFPLDGGVLLTPPSGKRLAWIARTGR